MKPTVVAGYYRVSQKNGFKNLIRYDYYCYKEHFYGSKLGRNMINAFDITWQLLILM